MTFKKTITSITRRNTNIEEQCKQRWNTIAKPLYSLGKLESNIAAIGGMMETCDVRLDKKGLVIFCGDNGVVEEGVTQSGQEVTAIVSENFLSGQTSVAIMAKKVGVTLFPIDIGMAVDTKVPKRKVAYGTKNMAKEWAMTREEAIQAIEIGIDVACELKEEGYQILATGEMGIGNTTTSSAICAVLLEQPVSVVTGKGAGLSSTGLERKIQVIEQAIALHKPKKEDPIDVLAKVGGLDIAGLVGVFLGGAVSKIPVIIDGFISAVAALIAIRLCPSVSDYVLASHISKEPAGKLMLEALGKEACLTCDMCLGEGTGAIAFLPVLELGLLVYQQMSTFDETEIDSYQTLS